MTSRRGFLTQLAQGGAMAACGGLIWGYLLGAQQARGAVNALKPPGARPDSEFNATCIKCGKCVVACPYDTLRLAAPGEAVPVGTPYYIAREVPCYMCPDIPCVRSCPTGALDPGLTKIEAARMGLAVIDIEHCLSWQGLRCEICHRECPLKDRAISVVHNPRKTSKHALFVPLVHSDACTGCGICERACPTEAAAIRVVPPELVQGRIGGHYRLGWTIDTPITQDFEPAAGPGAGPGGSGGSALDYLNAGEP